ncbi:MAG: hypothetical protein WCF99_08400 [Chloroflexales bacterium]
MGKKQQQQKKGVAQLARPTGGMAITVGWSVHEVLLSQGWNQEGALVSVLVARMSPRSGKVAAASYLVDLACLGIKGTQVMMFKDSDEYAAGLRAHIVQHLPMAPSNINLAAKIVGIGYEYAASMGFSPDPIFAQSRYLLEGANPNADPTPVRTGGKDGKPWFISGPNDNVAQILAQLQRVVGEGNYHFLLGEELMDSDDDFLDDGKFIIDHDPR